MVVVKTFDAQYVVGWHILYTDAFIAVKRLNDLFAMPSKAPERPEAPGLPKPWLEACALAAGLKPSDHPWAGANDTPLEVRVVDLEAQVAALDGRLGCVEQFIKTL